MKSEVLTVSDDKHAFRRNERGAEAFAHAARHSRRVHFFKILLPLLALALVVGFAFYTYFPRHKSASVEIDQTVIESGELIMANPTLDGFTGSNQPYSVTAKRARQPIGEPLGAFTLEEIKALVPFGDEDQAKILAGGGKLDRERNRLILNKEINIETTSGITAHLQSAEVDMMTKTVHSDEQVQIELNGMRIDANTFKTLEGGETLVFNGDVQILINPSELSRNSVNGEESAQ